MKKQERQCQLEMSGFDLKKVTWMLYARLFEFRILCHKQLFCLRDFTCIFMVWHCHGIVGILDISIWWEFTWWNGGLGSYPKLEPLDESLLNFYPLKIYWKNGKPNLLPNTSHHLKSARKKIRYPSNTLKVSTAWKLQTPCVISVNDNGSAVFSFLHFNNIIYF